MPSTFEDLLRLYPTVPIPLYIGKGDRKETTVSSQDEWIPLQVMRKWFYRTPGYPVDDDSGRYLYDEKVRLANGRWMLITYQEAYGDVLVASIFSADGQNLDGMKVFEENDDSTAKLTYFFLDEDTVLNLYSRLDVDGNRTRDTMRYIVTEEGRFQQK